MFLRLLQKPLEVCRILTKDLQANEHCFIGFLFYIEGGDVTCNG